MNQPKISVIVLTYNHAKYIAENLRRILMQRVNAHIELIISEDCSGDSTAAVIKSETENLPSNFSLKFFEHPKNLGATPNFYFALEQVTGDYIAFCEGDDYWTDPEKLQLQLDFMGSHAEYSMCFHQVMNISDDPSYKDKLFANVEERDYSMLEIYECWMVHTTSVFLRREVLRNNAAQMLLAHPQLLYFDTFLYMTCGLSGKIRGNSRTMSAYRRHEVGISNGINHRRDLRHNHLDMVIGNTFGGKIKESSNWQIFSRSRIAFRNSLMRGNLLLTWQHLHWILKRKGNLKVYLINKLLR